MAKNKETKNKVEMPVAMRAAEMLTKFTANLVCLHSAAGFQEHLLLPNEWGCTMDPVFKPL